MQKKTFNIVFFGSPGCGKGTHAAEVAERYHLQTISTGELYRNEIAAQTELGILAKKLIDAGQLCPDELTLNMLHNHIESMPETNGFILDGVPRTQKQAEMMDGIGYDKPINIDMVLYLEVTEEEAVRRILERSAISGRADDTLEVIKSRLENYAKLTQPLADYYEKQNKLYRVDAMSTIEVVSERIYKVLDPFFNR
ncbi:MAG: adenylate kinase [Bacteroidales bacterium]|nr:adenylate kinase [Bacteroidales bacterium]